VHYYSKATAAASKTKKTIGSIKKKKINNNVYTENWWPITYFNAIDICYVL